MMKRILACAALVMLGITTTASASVDIFGDTGNSSSGLGDFTATLTYLATDDQNATLTIAIENTSPPANGGYLVALAFVNPSDLISSVSLASTSASFDTLIGGPSFENAISVSPFGDLDIGASVTTDWLGGGSPTGGLAVGESATFTFTFGAASGLSGLNELSFLSADAKSDYGFLVRFRGFDNDGSDKVPGIIPEPASIAVWTLIGLAGLPAAVWHRRRKS